MVDYNSKRGIVNILNKAKAKAGKKETDNMGTRAVYTFKNKAGSESHSVYSHWDNYPAGAAEKIAKAFGNAWNLPRFEADEFGAAFIAANKVKSGDYRLTDGPEFHGDLDYTYEVFPSRTNEQICIRVSEIDGTIGKEIYYGRLKDFIAQYGDNDAIKLWNDADPSANKLPLKIAKQKLVATALAKLTDDEKIALGLSV